MDWTCMLCSLSLLYSLALVTAAEVIAEVIADEKKMRPNAYNTITTTPIIDNT